MVQGALGWLRVAVIMQVGAKPSCKKHSITQRNRAKHLHTPSKTPAFRAPCAYSLMAQSKRLIANLSAYLHGQKSCLESRAARRLNRLRK